ncbi:CapA family protein [Noviherbaspirillum pedocola]|uniref:CapA family protein n=1 Tax=Noviherbaspirillum pedocola TaxID=2801341 RepID=A0A934SXY7_9BURK|nr:CapA family protein [Noviherbaspirillum pedocola]MBK4737598.1 CapA family protein [Noviherbaspirillum pedocola]
MQAVQVSSAITLFLCGDVMTGRGIDQILPHPGRPELFENFVHSAREYVRLAEEKNGPIRRPVGFDYVWGHALDVLRHTAPDVRIMNLETAVTTSAQAWPGKGIHYRMHPANLPCLSAAGVDCCVLANNHVIDWGYQGLDDTLRSLHQAGITTAGAGCDAEEAAAPAVLDVPGKGRVLVFACALGDCGVPEAWRAGKARPGVNLLRDLDARNMQSITEKVRATKRAGDVVVMSIHWGGNWGFRIPAEHRDFAHRLIDSAGVDIVHGHSSHHVKGIEVYRGKLILYGCGDFLNDYEGIGGYEQFRGDLALMYFPVMKDGRLARLALTATQIRRLRDYPAPEEGVRWLMETLNREGRTLGTQVDRLTGTELLLRWRSAG